MAEMDDDIGDLELNLSEDEGKKMQKPNKRETSGIRKVAKQLKSVLNSNNVVEPSTDEIALTETSGHMSDGSLRPSSSSVTHDSRASTAIPRSPSQAFSEFTSEVSILNEGDNDNPSDVDELNLDSDDLSSVLKANISGTHCCSSCLCGSKKSGEWLIFNPEDSNFLFFWLTVVTIATIYNTWTIILRVAFRELQHKHSPLWFILDYTCDAVYVTDLLICLRTSYIERGMFVKDSQKLARHNVRTWRFVLDILSILPLDLFYLLVGVKLVFRINRVCKLYRVAIFNRMIETRTPLPNFWRVVNIFHSVLLLIHYNGCLYYLISEHQDFGQELTSWAYPDPTIYTDYATLPRKYLYSVYWSTLSLTTVSSLPAPESDQQYIYSIFQYILGVFVIAFVIGQVTNIVVNRNHSQMEYERILMRTKYFMQHRKVPKETQNKVQRFYDYVWASGQFHILDEGNVLRLLPSQMKTELALNANMAALEKVALFQDCESGLLSDLVLKLKHQMFSPGEFVCRAGQLGREMFLVSVGQLRVISSTEEEVQTIGEGAIFGEISVLNLNRGTRRTADVVSIGYSEIFILTNTDVLETLQDYPRAREVIAQQSRRRLQEQLNRAGSYGGCDSGFRRWGSSVASREPTFGRRRSSAARYRKISRTSSHFSRDSGFVSSPGQSLLSSGGSGSMSPMVEEVTSDLAARLQTACEENTRALKASLEYVLDHEVKYLRQRLHDTEKERDSRQREIGQLKTKVTKLQQQRQECNDGVNGTEVLDIEDAELHEY